MAVTCYLAHHGPCDYWGSKADNAHLVFRKQDLRRWWSDAFVAKKYGRPHNAAILEVSKEEFCKGVTVEICREHHERLDEKKRPYITLPPAQLPAEFWEFVDRFELHDKLPAEYEVGEAA